MVIIRCVKCGRRLFDIEPVEGYVEIFCPKCKYKNKIYLTASENGDFNPPEGTAIISID